MQMFRIAGLVTNWPWRRQQGPRRSLPRARAARRIEAYVYGNVLVLAAVIATGIEEVASGRTALIAIGTAVSTFVAHVLAMAVGHRADDAETEHGFRDALRDGAPMASSGVWPTIALSAGWVGWLPPNVAWYLAIGIVAVRFIALGSVVSYLDGEPSRWRTVLIGAGLALAGLLVALLKNALTH